jgi:hypothetical protein
MRIRRLIIVSYYEDQVFHTKNEGRYINTKTDILFALLRKEDTKIDIHFVLTTDEQGSYSD